MTEHHARNSHEERLLSQRQPRNEEENTLQTRSETRFWTRSLVLLLVPLFVMTYYYWIWQRLLCRDLDNVVKYGSITENWVYYSWFIIGVFSLEWSKYGLVGAEAAMLRSSIFSTPHLAGLLSHSESTWSGPGGWLRCLKAPWRRGNSRLNISVKTKELFHSLSSPSGWVAATSRLGGSLRTHRLWYLLAFLSFCLYVGLPLSGLTMELSDGYIQNDQHPRVVGRNGSTFHERLYGRDGPQARIIDVWKSGAPPNLPGIGVIYTPKYLSRDDQSGLQKLPNTLPMDQGIADMFIIPQAAAAISGTAWGLRTGYNCVIVEDAAEFNVLGKQPADKAWRFDVHTSSSTDANNLWSYSESASRMVQDHWLGPSYDGERPDPFDTVDPAGLDVFEYVMWQVRYAASYQEPDFNDTIDMAVRNMSSPFVQAKNGSMVANVSYFNKSYNVKLQQEVNDLLRRGKGGEIVGIHPAIGVQCQARSILGTAHVSAGTSQFSDFTPEHPTPYNETAHPAEETVKRLGNSASRMMGWASLGNLFSASNSRSIQTYSNSFAYTSFVSSKQLQKAWLLAFGRDILEMMYDGKYEFEGDWEHNQMTSSTKGKILTKGELSPWISVVPFGIWTAGSFILAVVYGFRKRRSESVSGLGLLRLGVNYSDELRGSSKLNNARDVEEVDEFRNLPGNLDVAEHLFTVAMELSNISSITTRQGSRNGPDNGQEPPSRTATAPW